MYNYMSISSLLSFRGRNELHCSALLYASSFVVVAIVVFVSSSRGCTSGGVYVPCMAGENTVGDSGHCCCTCAMYFER